jgi:hypothetical protein
MELTAEQGGLLGEYIRQFETLIGDRRTQAAFKEVVRGIISAGSLVCQRIAAHSAVLSAVKDGAQRVIRLARGESTRRSRLDAESLTGVLREGGIRRLSEAEGDELWLILDSSDLRKPYAQEMPSLMQVRDLDGDLVPGYRTLNVLGVTPQRRGILYHRLFSSEEAGFVSEPLEVQTGLRTVSQALQWKIASNSSKIAWAGRKCSSSICGVFAPSSLWAGWRPLSCMTWGLPSNGRKSTSWLAWADGALAKTARRARLCSPAACAA